MPKKPDDTRIAEAAAWQGTEPADGTRRGVILAALRAESPGDELDLADAIELALLQAAEKDGPAAVEGAETWQFEFPEINNPEDDEVRWRWRLIAGGNDIAAQSKSYPKKKEAEASAEEFKTHASRAGFPIGA